MPSKSYLKYKHYIRDVEDLVSIHQKINKGVKGKRGFGCLTRSATIILSQAWKNYFESIIYESLCIITHNKLSFTNLPSSIQKSLTLQNTESRYVNTINLDECHDWEFSLIRSIKFDAKDYTIAESDRIDFLFQKYLAFENIQRMLSISLDELNMIIDKGSKIVSFGPKSIYVKIEELVKYKKIISSFAKEIDLTLLDYLININPFEKRPWNKTY